MSKELILHVWLHKTATSSTQEALHIHVDSLKERGIIYPTFYGPYKNKIVNEEYNNSIHYFQNKFKVSEHEKHVLDQEVKKLRDQIQTHLPLDLEAFLRMIRNLEESIDAQPVFDFHTLTNQLDNLKLQISNLPVFDPEMFNKRIDSIQTQVAALPVYDPAPIVTKLNGFQDQIQDVRISLATVQNHLHDNVKRVFVENKKQFFQYEERKLCKSGILYRCYKLLAKILGISIKNNLNQNLFQDARIILESDLFDYNYYLKNYQDVLTSKIDPLLHFCKYGWKEFRNPSSKFTTKYYLYKYQDVKDAQINPLVHYILSGMQEGRMPTFLEEQRRILLKYFDKEYYLHKNIDVKNAGINPLQHYLETGWREKRNPCANFNTSEYIERFPEIIDQGINPFYHFITKISPEQQTSDCLSVFYEDSLIHCSECETDIKPIAFYLPQFHRVAENDEWWGEGFTDWSSCKRASPLFDDHWQPRKPHPDLGYYDLLDAHVLKKQADIASRHGVYGFAFYYYNFSGKRILEKPLDILLNHPEIGIKFCLCWANENWTRRWDGSDQEILLKQQYQPDDDLNTIKDISRYVRDPRYIRFDGKPLILIYRKAHLQNSVRVTNNWRKWCKNNGIGDIYLVCVQTYQDYSDPRKFGFDAASEMPAHLCCDGNYAIFNPQDLHSEVNATVYSYKDYANSIISHRKSTVVDYTLFRTVISKFDNTGRKQNSPHIFTNYSPDIFHAWLADTIEHSRRELPANNRFIFINAWNEWAEGTYMEPDLQYGYSLLNNISRALKGIPPVSWRKSERSDLTPATTLYLDTLFDKTDMLVPRNPRIAVHLHAYHENLLGVIFDYLQNIPYSYDLFVTTSRDDISLNIHSIINSQHNISQYKIISTPNKGRDIAPFFISVFHEIHSYDIVLHLHTKQSDLDWLKYLLDRILGTKNAVQRIVSELINEKETGLIYPQIYPRWLRHENYGGNRDFIVDVCQRCSLTIPDSERLHFPAGSFYWAKPAALIPIASAKWTYDDFPDEPIPDDSTVAHAVERLISAACVQSGFRTVTTALTHDQSTLPMKSHGYFNGYYQEKWYNNFIELFQKKVNGGCIKTVIFDIFDTLLSRPVSHPEDMFDLVAMSFDESYGISIDNFKSERIKAEILCRRELKSGKDVTLDGIYAMLAQSLNLSSHHAELIKKIEIDLELSSFCPKYTGIRMLKIARENNIKIILVSDMYMSRNFIDAALDKIGVAKIGFDKLYISSENGMRKDTAQIYKYLVDVEGVMPEVTIVVGDNLHSDVHLPSHMGFRTLYVPKDIDRLRELYIKAQLGSISLQSKKLTQHGIIAQTLFSNSDKRVTSLLDRNPYNIGYVLLGPLLCEVSRQISLIAKNMEIKRLHFLTREGIIMKDAYDIISNKTNDGIESRILYASRGITNCLNTNSEDDLNVIIDKNVYLKGKLGYFFEGRYNYKLTDDDWTILKSIGVDDRLYIFPDDKMIVKKAVSALADKLLLSMSKRAKVFKEYIANEISLSSAVVDIGYSGAMQDNIVKFLGHDIIGIYIMSLSNTNNKDHKISLFHENLMDAKKLENKFFKISYIYEALMMPTCNTVIGVGYDNHEYYPVYDDAPISEQEIQFRTMVHNGALDFVRHVCERFPIIPEFDFESVLWDLKDIAENPRLIDDILAFSGLTIDDKYSGACILHFLSNHGDHPPHFAKARSLLNDNKHKIN